MIHLSNTDARRLVKTLDAAQAGLREYAADQSYRADAYRLMRERIMAAFHRRQADSAGDLAEALTELGGLLLVRLDAVDDAA
ncbi:MAG: hypothetical protein QOI54_1836 [Actinomycetota bacterium]|nr:hypothetical protein [Actinomycetota bacterium]